MMTEFRFFCRNFTRGEYTYLEESLTVGDFDCGFEFRSVPCRRGIVQVRVIIQKELVSRRSKVCYSCEMKEMNYVRKHIYKIVFYGGVGVGHVLLCLNEAFPWVPGNLPLLPTWHVGNVTGCHADLYTVGRCCTRGESQEFMACRWQSTQARDPPWLWNLGETSSEVQNRGISGPTKRTHVLQKFKKKKKSSRLISCLTLLEEFVRLVITPGSKFRRSSFVEKVFAIH